MGSALLEPASAGPVVPQEADGFCIAAAGASGSADALRLLAATRLAAHRGRRRSAQVRNPHEHPPVPQVGHSSMETRSARIAAVVAERYAQSPSYRAFLAAEAERAVQQARAAAEIAALNVKLVAEVQQTLLAALAQDAAAAAGPIPRGEVSPQPPSSPSPSGGPGKHASRTDHAPAQALGSHPHLPAGRGRGHSGGLAENTPPGVTVRLFNGHASVMLPGTPARRAGQPRETDSRQGYSYRKPHENGNDAEAQALDEEIEFRQSPVFEEPAEQPVPLSANLIEFPRHLIASRKARPRHAEGPLREGEDAAPGSGQLRIFEVDPAHIGTSPEAVDPAAPQWSSIWLEAPARAEQPAPALDTQTGQVCETVTPAPMPASIARRTAAAAVNGALLMAGLLVFTAGFLLTQRHTIVRPASVPLRGLLGHIASGTGIPSGTALAAGAVSFFLYLLYQALFFSLSVATPGMRCARIALCTFADNNPTRSAMRRRIVAVVLSLCPLGLGLFWAVLDKERLSWHDRVCRMYQRSY